MRRNQRREEARRGIPSVDDTSGRDGNSMRAPVKPSSLRCAIAAAATLLAACGSSSSPSAPPGIDATGTWFGTLQSTDTAETASLVVDLKQQGAAVAAKMEMWSDTFNDGISMSGQMSAFTVSLSGGGDVKVTFSGVVAPDFTASGEYTLSSSAGTNHGTWTARRIPSITLVSQQRFSMTGQATAMTYDGVDLWVSGYGACGATYVGLCKMKLDGTGMTVLSPSPYPDACGGSMAYDGTHLWCTRGGAGVRSNDLYLLNPADGSISSQTLGPADQLAVAFDNQSKTMWCAYPWSVQSRLSAITGTVTKTVDLPLFSPISLAWDGSAFWLADWYPPKLYKLDQDGNVLGAADVPPMSSGDNLALAYDGSNLLAAVSSYSPNQAVIYAMMPQ